MYVCYNIFYVYIREVWKGSGGLNSQIFRIRNLEERQNLDMVQLSNDNFKLLYKNSTQNWSYVRKCVYYKGNRRSEFSFIKVFFFAELLSLTVVDDRS